MPDTTPTLHLSLPDPDPDQHFLPTKLSVDDRKYIYARLRAYDLSPRAAYCRAYPLEAAAIGPAAQYSRGMKLDEDKTVMRYIADIRDSEVARERVTVEHHLHNLKTIRDDAFTNGDRRTALKAEELVGKVCGFYIERSVNLNMDATEEELVAQLRILAQNDPEIARTLAESNPSIAGLITTAKDGSEVITPTPGSDQTSLPEQATPEPDQTDPAPTSPDCPTLDEPVWT